MMCIWFQMSTRTGASNAPPSRSGHHVGVVHTINDKGKVCQFSPQAAIYYSSHCPVHGRLCSSVAPLITNNLKTTYECHTPAAVIADLDIIAKAPQAMIAAFGTLGKYTCLLDWKLSAIINMSITVKQ